MTDRWRDQANQEIQSRAFREARKLGHSWCGTDHVLLALLDPPAPTDAAAVLSQLGLTRSEAETRLTPRWSTTQAPDGDGISPNPAFYALLGEARGLALAEGASAVSDEHALLALAYGGGHSLLVGLDIDAEQVVTALAALGLSVPPLLPPERPPPAEPFGSRVYYPATEQDAVVHAMLTRCPPGTAQWGFNVSRWKPGFHYIDAEESCDAPATIAAAVTDASAIEVVDIETATHEEGQADPTE